MRVSMRWPISPKRMAPAKRALPFRVCRWRSTPERAPMSSGRATQRRRVVPMSGMSSTASSSKIGNRSGSITSTASISSASKSISRSASMAAVSASTARAGAALIWAKGAGSESTAAAALCNSRTARTRSGDGDLRKPAANWWSRWRISSAACTQTLAQSGVPPAMICTCCRLCSRLRAKSDSAMKPTVAELPASECASAMHDSGTGRCSSIAHSPSSVTKRRDHSSASLRYTLYRGRLIWSEPITLTCSSTAGGSATGAAMTATTAAVAAVTTDKAAEEATAGSGAGAEAGSGSLLNSASRSSRLSSNASGSVTSGRVNASFTPSDISAVGRSSSKSKSPSPPSAAAGFGATSSADSNAGFSGMAADAVGS